MVQPTRTLGVQERERTYRPPMYERKKWCNRLNGRRIHNALNGKELIWVFSEDGFQAREGGENRQGQGLFRYQ